MGLGPRHLHQVDYSAVKEAAESQGGRMEFVRQAATLGLAGLGGLGVLLFTESSANLSSRWMIVTVGLAGLASLATLVTSMTTLTTYANYLRVLGGETGAAPQLPAGVPGSDRYESRIKRYLLLLFFSLIVMAIAIVLLGYLRLSAPEIGAAQAIEEGRQLVSRQTGTSPDTLQLTSLEGTNADFLITYAAATTGSLYIVRLDRQTLEARSFSHSTPPRPAASADRMSTLGEVKQALSAIGTATAALVNTAKDIDRHGVDEATVLRCYAAAIRADLEKGPDAGWSEADLSSDQRRAIQRSLVDQGFLKPNGRNPNPVDGVFGGLTRAAIAAWHRQNGVSPASETLTRRDAAALGVQVEVAKAAQRDCDASVVGAPASP
jgi:hypothetical protein